jgi:inosine/xanthosine triphosphatase
VSQSENLRVVVASENPVKVRAALGGFRAMFRDKAVQAAGISVPLVVAVQPRTDAETLRGAEARVSHAQNLSPNADFWVGIEGGVADLGQEMAAFAWVVVRSRGRTGRARTGTFFLPEAVRDLVRQGIELGLADDRVFGTTNSKQDAGAVGLLTGGVIDRGPLSPRRPARADSTGRVLYQAMRKAMLSRNAAPLEPRRAQETCRPATPRSARRAAVRELQDRSEGLAWWGCSRRSPRRE